jgi:lysophospholipase L1-like esterase
MSSRRWYGKGTLRKVAFSAALTVAGLEAALWLLHPLSVFPEEWRCDYTQDLPGLKRKVTYERNMFGFRSVSGARARSAKKPPGAVRIICLGASTTDLPTQNAEDTWWGILEKRLNDEFRPEGRRVEVWARGRGGETAADALRWARHDLRSYAPDIVVLLQGVNDLCWHGGRGYTGAPEPGDAARPRKEWGGYPKWKLCLRQVSQIYRHASALRQRWRVREAIREGAAVEWHSGALPLLRQEHLQRPFRETLARDPDPIHEFGGRIQDLLTHLRASGVRCVVCEQPVLWSADLPEETRKCLWMPVATPSGFVRASPGWLAGEMAKYNRMQEAAALRSGARFVELASRLPRTPEMFFDDCHYTDLGNRRMAEAIFPALGDEVRLAIAGTSRPAGAGGEGK